MEGTALTIVGKKRGGVEGGAIVSLSDRRVDGQADQKKYMLKGIYGKTNQKGKFLQKPNAKGSFRKWATQITEKEANRSAIREFLSLDVARTINPEIAPEAKLGM